MSTTPVEVASVTSLPEEDVLNLQENNRPDDESEETPPPLYHILSPVKASVSSGDDNTIPCNT